MRAVAFTSPLDCLIREGLPPSERWGGTACRPLLLHAKTC